tara:strand:- start:5 stop:628 length:624 start_codon:yes stop_codon:yes gene_type:complete
MEKLLQNKYVLYLVLFIAITNILGYLAIEDFRSLMVFIAVAALASHFSKNMIIVLGSALIGTNVLYASSRMREGLTNKKEVEKKIKTAVAKKKVDGMAVREGKPDKVELEEVEEDVEVKTPRVDYAATMEIAYDNLNKMLGEGGMKNLTKDTKGLMDQQKDLMKQLKDFAPLMEQAGNMLDKLGGMDNLKGLMGKVGGIGLANGKKK